MKAKAERNRALVAAYRGGDTLATVARAFGMSESNAWRLICAAGAEPCFTEARRRWTAANLRKAADDTFRARQSARMTAWWAERRRA